MASTAHNSGGYQWGYLVNPDKSASPMLRQLCEALAEMIPKLQPGPDRSLTPQRLSSFYRSVGGNDFIFRELGHPGLSLMYRTLGCFHSLQPTSSAYEPPSVPCLHPAGFVRWQTLQLLLHPDEHALCMQKAVELYDIPKPGGGHFPKIIPRESFPAKPDGEMEKWHAMVLGILDDTPKIKNSPYYSPYEAPDPGGCYFPRGSLHTRRASRPQRSDQTDPHHLAASSRRRSSVPSIPSPIHPPDTLDTGHHWSSDQAFSAPNTAMPRSPRHRASVSTSNQSPSKPHHHSAHSHNTATTGSTSAKSFSLNFENFHFPFISSPFSSKKNRDRSSTSGARTRPRPRTSTQSAAVSTGSEASSEDSLPRVPRPEHHRRRSSLAPPDEYNRYQRRHSHDASYLQQSMNAPTSSPQSHRPHNGQSQNQSHPHIPPPTPAGLPPQFRDDLYHNPQHSSSAPQSPTGGGGSPNPRLRVIDPLGRDQSRDRGRDSRHHYASGAETLQERRAVSAERRSRSGGRRAVAGGERYVGLDRDRRREGVPLRVNTIAGAGVGVGGRGGKMQEVRSAGLPSGQARRAPSMSLSGGGRR